MASALDILDDLAPISELSNGRTSALLQRADHDPVILIKRNKPSYVLMNIENYRALMERIEDNEDLLLAEKDSTTVLAQLSATKRSCSISAFPQATSPRHLSRNSHELAS